MNKIVYTRGTKKPMFNKKNRALLKLNKLPIIRNFSFVRKLVSSIYNLPFDAKINKDFYCSSPNLKVGKNVGLADTFILAYAPVSIGDNCSFSYRNMIITSTHDLNDFSTVVAKPITIGKNVWITTNVIILPGVTIGDNTVIGAGSVVSKDIPSGVFAAGNPCNVIREIEFHK
jgi:maltose O-acetyltransferase